MTANIWVDCDGVLSDFVGLYLSILNAHTGRAHVHSDVTSWFMRECVASKAEDDFVWRHIDATPGLVGSMGLVDGAREALDTLRTLGTVRCLTAPHFGPTWMPERAQWLLRLGFTRKQVVFATDKALVPGDVLIDDKMDHCEEWQAAHPRGLAILFDTARNHGPTTVARAHGWDAALELVRKQLERRAPVQANNKLKPGEPGCGPGTITWTEHEEAWRAYAKRYGKQQDAEDIARRHGFDYPELKWLLGRTPATWRPL
jgi:5'(3')-deoxyribonucleotidase